MKFYVPRSSLSLRRQEEAEKKLELVQARQEAERQMRATAVQNPLSLNPFPNHLEKKKVKKGLK